MDETKVIILGGGISGLAAAWYLKKLKPNSSIKILEKEQKAGGVIGRVHADSSFFILGPKTFAAARSEPLLHLIEELHLESLLIFSKPEASIRYIYHDHKLHKLPRSLLEFISCPIMIKALPGLIREFFIQQSKIDEDETVGDFFRRRFGDYITDVLVDPFVLGIYAADINELSMQACFGFLKELEKKYGSVIKGMLKKKKESSSSYPKQGLLSLKGGLYTLVEMLEAKLKKELIKGEKVVEVKQLHKGFLVKTSKHEYEADIVISALNFEALKQLKTPFHQELVNIMGSSASSTVISVNMAFRGRDILKKKGFGYLVPTKELDTILGVVFDSEVFDLTTDLTLLTVMMGGEKSQELLHMQNSQLVAIAREALRRHLGIYEEEQRAVVTRYPEAILRCPLHHVEHIQSLEKVLKERYKGCYLTGNFIKGASVSSCIKTSRKLAEDIAACS